MGAGKEPLKGSRCFSGDIPGIRETGAVSQNVSGIGRRMLRAAAVFILMTLCASTVPGCSSGGQVGSPEC